jgi:hypothetical protein
MISARTLLIGALAMLGAGPLALAQSGPSPREAAPADFTGYWVSVVTEDWRWRMVTPKKGDYASVPLNDEGRRVADTWDPDRDDGTCRPYGAPGLMRLPLRVHFEWEDDDTLRLETDHGQQTRLLHFNPAEASGGPPSRQGHSVATWEAASLKVVTTNLLPGYLRLNGVPFSEGTVLTEYFDRHASYGDEWFTVTAIVNDPRYLNEEFITSSSFKQLPDASHWHPTNCEER